MQGWWSDSQILGAGHEKTLEYMDYEGTLLAYKIEVGVSDPPRSPSSTTPAMIECGFTCLFLLVVSNRVKMKYEPN